MTEFDDFFLENNDLLELQRAMEDPLVVEATAMARERAKLMNAEEVISDDYPAVDETTMELDAMVNHLMDTTLEVSGVFWRRDLDEGREYRVAASEAYAVFNGFVAHASDGVLEYRYIFNVSVDDNNPTELRARSQPELIATAHNDPESGGILLPVTASFDSVHLSFDAVHPARAMAWLSMEYPETVRAIDDLVIGEGDELSDHQLMRLKHFSMPLSEDTPGEQLTMLRKSLKEYAGGFIGIDTQVPYGIVLNGDATEITSDGEEQIVQFDKQGALLSVVSLTTYSDTVASIEDNNTVEGGIQYSFGIYGILHSHDPDVRGRQIVVPLRSVQELSALRGLY